MASKLDAARAALKRARDKVRDANEKTVRRVTIGAAGYALAKYEDRVPTILGMSPELTVAGAALAVEYFSGDGKMGAIASGIADSSIAIGAYKFGGGGGVQGYGVQGDDLDADLPELVSGYDDELLTPEEEAVMAEALAD